jgi:hypothetical protein
VLEVPASSVVCLDGGKVKFPTCEVVLCGDRKSATDMIYAHAPCGTAIVGSTLTGGDRSTLTGGYDSTLTGGNDSTLTGGDRSTLTGGNDSTLTGGNDSTLTGGNDSSLSTRWWDGNRYRTATFYVGEAGIEPNVPYRAEGGKLTRIESCDRMEP